MALDENRIINTEVEAVTCRKFSHSGSLYENMASSSRLIMRRKTLLVG